MNKSYVLYNLREAQEQLSQTIEALESDQDYDVGDFLPDMSHLYHHVNTAWNAQDATEDSVEQCIEEDFNRWRSMPQGEELLLVE